MNVTLVFVCGHIIMLEVGSYRVTAGTGAALRRNAPARAFLFVAANTENEIRHRQNNAHILEQFKDVTFVLSPQDVITWGPILEFYCGRVRVENNDMIPSASSYEDDEDDCNVSRTLRTTETHGTASDRKLLTLVTSVNFTVLFVDILVNLQGERCKVPNFVSSSNMTGYRSSLPDMLQMWVPRVLGGKQDNRILKFLRLGMIVVEDLISIAKLFENKHKPPTSREYRKLIASAHSLSCGGKTTEIIRWVPLDAPDEVVSMKTVVKDEDGKVMSVDVQIPNIVGLGVDRDNHARVHSDSRQSHEEVIYGYKYASAEGSPCIVKLAVPLHALIAFSRDDTKIRTSMAWVLSIRKFSVVLSKDLHPDGNVSRSPEELEDIIGALKAIGIMEEESANDNMVVEQVKYDREDSPLATSCVFGEPFRYPLGVIVEPPKFNGDLDVACAEGIHFNFMQTEALAWGGILVDNSVIRGFSEMENIHVS